jgi:hypothetical protein
MHAEQRGTQGRCTASVRIGKQVFHCEKVRAADDCLFRDSGVFHPYWHVDGESPPDCLEVQAEEGKAREACEGGETT